MDNQLKVIFGSWIQAIGTVISAIGSTPSIVNNKEIQFNLNLWGNTLQATGNSVLADVQETINFEKIGNEIQAIGNSTIIAAMIIRFSEETEQGLTTKGNLIQALGGGVALGDDLGQKVSPVETLSIIGNILQIIGNSLQAIGGVFKLEKNNDSNETNNSDGESLEVIGGWIQAVGAILSAIGQTKETIVEKDTNGSGETDGIRFSDWNY